MVGLRFGEVKALIQEYYGLFYLDVSPSRIGIWGGFAFIFSFAFCLMFGFSIYVYYLGVEYAAQALFGIVLVFEVGAIWFFYLEANSQLRLTMKKAGLLGLPAKEFTSKDLNSYKLNWIKMRFSIDEQDLVGLCEKLEAMYLLEKRYEEAANGRYGSSMRKFFSVPKDRFVALLLAYISMLVLVAGGSEFTLERFFGFYGDLSGYFGFSLVIFMFFLSIFFILLALATPMQLVFNCVWHSLTGKFRVCTKMTFYIFLRDCNRLAKI